MTATQRSPQRPQRLHPPRPGWALLLGALLALAACGDDGGDTDVETNTNNATTSTNSATTGTGTGTGTNNSSTGTNNGTSTSTNNGTSTGTNNGTTTPLIDILDVLLAASPNTSAVGDDPAQLFVSAQASDDLVTEPVFVDLAFRSILDGSRTADNTIATIGSGDVTTRVELLGFDGTATGLSWTCLRPGDDTIVATIEGVEFATAQITCLAASSVFALEWGDLPAERELGTEPFTVAARLRLQNMENGGLGQRPVALDLGPSPTLELLTDAQVLTGADGIATWTLQPTGDPGPTALTATLLAADQATPSDLTTSGTVEVVEAPEDAPELAFELERDGQVLPRAAWRLRADGQDEGTLSVTVTPAPDASYSVEGLAVTFRKLDNVGYLKDGPDDTEERTSVEATTDAEGRASVTVAAGGRGGTSAIEVQITDPRDPEAEPLEERLQIEVAALTFLEVSGLTGFTMGLNYGDGDPEAISVTWRALDGQRRPLSGVPVTFVRSVEREGTVLEPTETTSDAQGRVTATLTTGTEQGSAAIIAEAVLGENVISIASPPLPMIAGRASAADFEVTCTPAALPGLQALNGTDSTVSSEARCSSRLLDRFGNPLGVDQPIAWLAEGGSIATPTRVEPWNTDIHSVRPPPETGTLSTTFDTLGAAPCDVVAVDGEPNTPNASCGQLDRPNCPVPDDACTHNPRDGLLGLVAATPGEEPFTDTNANGVYDVGEPYLDLPEPFVDTNDNGTYDPGEPFLDIGPDGAGVDGGGNGVWDDADGQWSADGWIWAPAYVLSAGASPFAQTLFFDTDAPEAPATEGQALSGDLGVHPRDVNGNPLPTGTRWTVSLEGAPDGITVQPAAGQVGGPLALPVQLTDTRNAAGGERVRAFGPWSEADRAEPIVLQLDVFDPDLAPATATVTVTYAFDIAGQEVTLGATSFTVALP